MSARNDFFLSNYTRRSFVIIFCRHELLCSGKRLETRGIRKLPPKLDSSHPNWKETPCLVNRDHNVLVGGLNQAKIFTNSVETKEGLPSQIESLYDPDTVDKHIELVQM